MDRSTAKEGERPSNDRLEGHLSPKGDNLDHNYHICSGVHSKTRTHQTILNNESIKISSIENYEGIAT